MPTIYDLNRLAEEQRQKTTSFWSQLQWFVPKVIGINAFEALLLFAAQGPFAYVPKYRFKEHPIVQTTSLAARAIGRIYGFKTPQETVVAQIIQNQNIPDTVKQQLFNKLQSADWTHGWVKYGQPPFLNEQILGVYLRDLIQQASASGTLKSVAQKLITAHPKWNIGVDELINKLASDNIPLWGKGYRLLKEYLTRQGQSQLEQQIAKQLGWYRIQRIPMGFYTAYQKYQVMSLVTSLVGIGYQAGVTIYERNQLLRYYRRLGNIANVQYVQGRNNLGYSKAEEQLITRQLQTQQFTKMVLNDQGVFGTNPYQAIYL